MCAHQVRSYVHLVSTDDRTDEPTNQPHGAEDSTEQAYEIRVDGRLGTRWATWFDGMTVTPAGDGTTVIHGVVADQAALHGLLEKLRDLGITLLSLTSSPITAPGAPT